MFSCTYLGWQGWLIEGSKGRVLVDPLLTEELGRSPPEVRRKLWTSFWPPRQFEWSAFPSIDAVLFTHEHEDHFTLSTIARIDRRIPLFLSAGSSAASHAILREMGFRTAILRADEQIRVEDLDFTFLAADHVTFTQSDEWDTLAFAAHQVDGHGAFFTNVDVQLTPNMDAALQRMSMSTQVVTFVRMGMSLFVPERVHAPAYDMHSLGDGVQFELDPVRAFEQLEAGECFRPVSGQTAKMEAGKLVGVESSAPFLTTPQSDRWPSRPASERDDDFEPIGGTKEFPEGLLGELEADLDDLAKFLYATKIFRTLYSLSEKNLDGRKPTFALILLAGASGEAFAYEYSAQRCAFVQPPQDEDFRASYAGVVVLWANDLLAAFRGWFEPRALSRAYRQYWHPRCASLHFPRDVLWPYMHPLRHPDKVLARYRAVAEAERHAPVLVRSR
jgi:hypothetical protein